MLILRTACSFSIVYTSCLILSEHSFDFVYLFQLMAVFHEDQRGGTDSPRDTMSLFHEDLRGWTESPRDTMSNGFSSAAPSPESMHYYPHLEYEDPARGEIEVNEAILKGSMSNLLHVIS